MSQEPPSTFDQAMLRTQQGELSNPRPLSGAIQDGWNEPLPVVLDSCMNLA